MNFKAAFEKGAKILQAELIKELKAQGHNNTGSLVESFTYMFGSEGSKNVLEGYANDYAHILDTGYSSESVSWKQLPFLIKFFESKGLDSKEAKQAAAATIVVWKKEGVPTNASSRFSKSGQRTNFIQTVEKVISDKMNEVVMSEINNEVNKLFNKTKSEII